MALRNDRSGVIFYFETAGQHVTAIDKEGKLLWHKNVVAGTPIQGFSKNGATVWPTICYAR